jgi:hypothetical protein
LFLRNDNVPLDHPATTQILRRLFRWRRLQIAESTMTEQDNTYACALTS